MQLTILGVEALQFQHLNCRRFCKSCPERKQIGLWKDLCKGWSWGTTILTSVSNYLVIAFGWMVKKLGPGFQCQFFHWVPRILGKWSGNEGSYDHLGHCLDNFGELLWINHFWSAGWLFEGTWKIVFGDMKPCQLRLLDPSLLHVFWHFWQNS